ncbi:MAG: helix-turn-helix domain-containing protein [Bifidobacteriaceae bacterium]|nr:helix-turn-helix domain-containing protein [Bifidobacteriaceae bacterium]
MYLTARKVFRLSQTPKETKTAVNHNTLTTTELSDRWAVPVSTLAHWRSLGYGPAYVKPRGIVRYRQTDIEAFEEECLTIPRRTAG